MTETRTIEPIPIGDLLGPLCDRLGLDYSFVGEIVIRPRGLQAVVYRKNEDGQKYVDANTRKPATETVSYIVSTDREERAA